MDTYDVIVLGSGHNGLILQAYLARAGLDVLCLESRDVAGGGLTTIERPAGSGFWHNTHSFFHRGVTRLPWYIGLELERRGAKYIEPPFNVALLCEDGRSLEWWDDFEKTYASFEAISPQDARTLRRWRDDFVPIVSGILEPEAQRPPLPPDVRRKLLSASPEGRLLLETSPLSPLEFVLREFKHPAVQAALLFFNGLREVDLREPGFGHHVPSLMASQRMAQMCAGGSRHLAASLIHAVEESGGKIRVSSRPLRIVVEGGRAVGVETAGGDVIKARRAVVSSLNPQQTFLELIDESLLPRDWVEKARAFRYNLLGPLFALNLNLSDRPRYSAAEKRPELNDAFMFILGIEHPDRLLKIVENHEAGTIPPTVMWGTCPTQFDPSQAPAGRHTAFMWEKLPYRLNGDAKNWDAAKDAHGQDMLRAWARYAPNLNDAVLESFTASPLDVERTLENMRGGDLLGGSLGYGQTGYNRPFAGAGHYRGHLTGLYLCGSSCFPGGNITGMPGYNSAQVVLSDLGLKPSWAPGPIEEQYAKLAG